MMILVTFFMLRARMSSGSEGRGYLSLASCRGTALDLSRNSWLYPERTLKMYIHELEADLKTLHHTRRYSLLMRYSQGLTLWRSSSAFLSRPANWQAEIITLLLSFITRVNLSSPFSSFSPGLGSVLSVLWEALFGVLVVCSCIFSTCSSCRKRNMTVPIVRIPK